MKITIYSRGGCSFCISAKSFMDVNQIPYKVINVDVDITADEVKAKFPDARTLPIILVDGKVIGGYRELVKFFNKDK